MWLKMIKGTEKSRWIKVGSILVILASLLFFPSLSSAQPEPLGRHVFYLGELPQLLSFGAVTNELSSVGIETEEIFKGNCLSWKETIDGGDIKVFATEDKIWIDIVISTTEGAEPFLADFLEAIAKERGLSAPQNCHFTGAVTITIVNPDGTIDLAGMGVSYSRETEYYGIVAKEEVMERYQVPQEDVSMELEAGQVYWLVKTKDSVQKMKAMTYEGGEQGEVPEGKQREGLGCAR
jgi:hypothetical protein